jgi:hypothetical protein
MMAGKSPMKPNHRVQIDSDTDAIILTRGQVAVIDHDTPPLTHRYHFHEGYARRWVRLPDGRRTNQQLAADLLGIEPGQGCRRDALRPDHIDKDRLNDRMSNLRILTCAQNAGSATERAGVYFNKAKRKWQAQIMVHGHNVFLGLRCNRENAHVLYDAACALLDEATAQPRDLAWRAEFRRLVKETIRR